MSWVHTASSCHSLCVCGLLGWTSPICTLSTLLSHINLKRGTSRLWLSHFRKKKYPQWDKLYDTAALNQHTFLQSGLLLSPTLKVSHARLCASFTVIKYGNPFPQVKGKDRLKTKADEKIFPWLVIRIYTWCALVLEANSTAALITTERNIHFPLLLMVQNQDMYIISTLFLLKSNADVYNVKY